MARLAAKAAAIPVAANRCPAAWSNFFRFCPELFYRRNEIVSRSTPADYCAILAHGAAIQLSKYPVSVANPLATRFCPASTETLSSGKSPASA